MPLLPPPPLHVSDKAAAAAKDLDCKVPRGGGGRRRWRRRRLKREIGRKGCAPSLRRGVQEGGGSGCNARLRNLFSSFYLFLSCPFFLLHRLSQANFFPETSSPALSVHPFCCQISRGGHLLPSLPPITGSLRALRPRVITRFREHDVLRTSSLKWAKCSDSDWLIILIHMCVHTQAHSTVSHLGSGAAVLMQYLIGLGDLPISNLPSPSLRTAPMPGLPTARCGCPF